MAGLIHLTASAHTPEASVSQLLQVGVLEALSYLLILFEGMQALLDLVDSQRAEVPHGANIA